MKLSRRKLYSRLIGFIFFYIRKIPYVRNKIENELDKMKKFIVKTIHKYDTDKNFIKFLPENPIDFDEIIKISEKYELMSSFNEKQISGAIYTLHKDDEHIKLLLKIFESYAYSNPLHPDIFPGCRRMESEVIKIVSNLFHGDDNVRGVMTSGGTESIMLAMLAYRNLAYSKGIKDPEMIIPITAHAAFDKVISFLLSFICFYIKLLNYSNNVGLIQASHLFNIRLKHVNVLTDNRVNVNEMRKAISNNTCALVCSAPNFPSGTIDDIEKVAKIGERFGIPVHVDACLGGFLIVFMEECGFPLPLFDFRLQGVTSISCDTHKYGYAPKGSSVILYRDKNYLHYQYSCIPEWTGGIYATPTLAGDIFILCNNTLVFGSRCGMSIALAWATLLYFGRSRYLERTKAIITCARTIANAISGISNEVMIKFNFRLKLLGSPDVSVVAFTSDIFNIYALADQMASFGWNLNSLQNPAAIHICVTYNTAIFNAADDFIRDLKKVAANLMVNPSDGNKSSTASIYGLAASIPDKSLVSDVAYMYLDSCYEMPFSE
ncbi:unnamed protein product [Dracunculus medinensis]|uniref:sphinganine-1-phosphate aldolase n=1 Tax=Dracunculus medinensis TaxID=318479 RepID=A0A0N4UC52_DRAME|nr:unnamed protein product [Dracunculus medinensis]